ncbi:hypothetical protein [Actinomadura sediminis]|uniref:Uncharacterized protein n=1 Tax=Actinomadura sediminis TaxID=1038904 RepID=A0ABW3EXY2_9ACTN
MSGWNPPPPPGAPGGGPPGGPGVPPGARHAGPPAGAPGGPPAGPGGGPFPGAPGGAPVPPPPRKGRPGLLIGLPAGFIAVLVLLAVGLYAGYASATGHTLSTPSSVGDMSRDTEIEGEKAVVDARNQLETVITRATEHGITDFESAVYRDGDLTYLFVGGTGEHDAGVTDDQAYEVMPRLDRAIEEVFRSTYTGNAPVTYDASTSALKSSGLGDLEMSTSVTANVHTAAGTRTGFSYLRGWSTRTTFGLVVLGPGGSRELRESAELTHKMRQIRDAVED